MNRRIALAVVLSFAGPIAFALSGLFPGGSPGNFSVLLLLLSITLVSLLVAGYFFGRGAGVPGIAGCLISPTLFLLVAIAAEAAHPPPERAFLDILLIFLPLMFLFFVFSLIPAGIGITLRRRAARKGQAELSTNNL